jgi:hypothetical protein
MRQTAKFHGAIATNIRMGEILPTCRFDRIDDAEFVLRQQCRSCFVAIEIVEYLLTIKRHTPQPDPRTIGTIPAPMYCKPRYAIGGVIVAIYVIRRRDLRVKCHIAFIQEGDCPCDCHPPFVPR